MKKVKVLHFELSNHIGGIEIFLLNLYTQIDRSKVQFDFITTVDNPALEIKFKNLGGHIYKVAPYRRILRYQHDIENILYNGYDAVHIHKNSAANVLPFRIAQKCGVRLVLSHSHNTAPSIGKLTEFMHNINKRYLYKSSELHFACSTAAGRWLYGERNFSIVTNGILSSRFIFDEKRRADKREELAFDDETFVIGHIGRFTKQKNHLLLLDIFKSIHLRENNSKLLLIGEGELAQEIKEKATDIGLGDSVIFTGMQTNIADFLMSMDAFVMPSLYEGLPIVGIEAQAAGVPLYLSDTISSETKITENVKWFSNDDNVNKIASSILYGHRINGYERRISNSLVNEGGYDIMKTANIMMKHYLNVKRL